MLFTRREWIPLDSIPYVLGRIYMFCIALFVSLPYLDCSISRLLSDIYVYIMCVVVYFPQVPPSKTREHQNVLLAKAAHRPRKRECGLVYVLSYAFWPFLVFASAWYGKFEAKCHQPGRR